MASTPYSDTYRSKTRCSHLRPQMVLSRRKNATRQAPQLQPIRNTSYLTTHLSIQLSIIILFYSSNCVCNVVQHPCDTVPLFLWPFGESANCRASTPLPSRYAPEDAGARSSLSGIHPYIISRRTHRNAAKQCIRRKAANK